MFIFENEQAVIDGTAEYISSKIAKLTKEIEAITNHNTLAYKVAIARRAAYGDVLYLLTNYTLRSEDKA